MKRCDWCGNDPLYTEYHDKEWGVPSHNDQHLFEMLILEGMQAGLSWLTVLRKRENFRLAFAGFDAVKLAKFTDKRLEMILQNPGIIRNHRKVFAVRQNANAFLNIQEIHGSFNDYIWQFVDGETIKNKWRHVKQLPATSKESDRMAKELKKNGFVFVGSTICYAYMQAVGMVNDHITSCFRF